MLNIIKWILLFIWQLPQNIVAICMYPFLGKKTLKCTKRYCWCIIAEGMKNRGSISLGNFIYLDSKCDVICAHELGHVVDSHKMGWLYLFIIGLPSAIWAGFKIYKKKEISYYSLYTEKRANKNSHIHDILNNYEDLKRWYLEFDEGYNLDNIK